MIDKNVHKEIRAAIKGGDIKQVAQLIESDRERLTMMTPFGTWLHVAASSGQLAIAKLLLELGADVNAVGGTLGGGALNVAASEGHIEVVQCLLQRGAVLDISEPERNPLFGAIYGGHAEIAALLLNAGIDADVRYTGESMKDMDAVAFAHERGQQEIREMILAHRSAQDSA